MGIYIEQVILTNAVVGFVLLYIASKLTSVYVCILRFILASAVNGGFSVLLFVYPSFVLRIAVFLTVCATAVAAGRNIRSQIAFVLMFLMTNILMSGCVFLILSFSGTEYIFSGGYIVSNGLLVVVFGAATAGIVMSYLLRRALIKAEQRVSCECCIKLIEKEGTTEIRALIDTGNKLVTPFARIPTVVADAAVYDSLSCQGRRVRVGCKTVAGSTVLIGYLPYKTEITYMGKTWRTEIAVLRSENEISGEHKALVNPLAIMKL